MIFNKQEKKHIKMMLNQVTFSPTTFNNYWFPKENAINRK